MSKLELELFDVNELARVWHVSTQSIRRWERQKRLKSVRLGTRVLFHPDDAHEFIEQARHASDREQAVAA